MITAALLPLALALIPSALGSCGHGLHWIQPRATSDGTVPVSTFSYGTTTGPLNWHNLANGNFLCGNGTNQSPILLNSTSTSVPKESIKLSIPLGHEVEFENLGTTVEVVASGTMTVAGQNWNLAQFHFHTPSEHRVDNLHFDAEMHLVFAAADGSKRTAVIAFFIEVAATSSNTLLENIFSHLGAIQKPGQTTTIDGLDFSGFQNTANSNRYYHYTGSLTTPPCSEGVEWYLSTTPISLKAATYVRLKATTQTNNRYIQNLLGQKNLLQVAAAGL